jgi:hypothetical protein
MDAPKIRGVVVNRYGEPGEVFTNVPSCPLQGFQFPAFQVHFDKRDSFIDIPVKRGNVDLARPGRTDAAR